MSSRVAVRDPRPRAPLRDADHAPRGYTQRDHAQRGTTRRNDSRAGDAFQDHDTFDPQDDLMMRRATRHERLRAARERQLRERQLLERARRERAQLNSTPRQQMAQPLTAEHTLRVVPGGQAQRGTQTNNDQANDVVDEDTTDVAETGCVSKCPPCHRGLYALTLLLAVLSIPLVYSASTAIALDHYGYTDYFLTRQIGFVLGGLFLLTAVSRVPARHIRGLVWVLFAVTVVGLLATKFTPLGLSMGGVRRWVKLGPIPLQFSELAKIALVGVLADFWSRASRTAQKEIWPWIVA
ncbi:MAG: FtsW/RodA/SpoVE family cell cycle protein, partial [Abitibacteriaceae bacterium]|nr:FtsW/RodA/SpoVE family cell cycle protein [Abditibacteriaceae bacterium]